MATYRLSVYVAKRSEGRSATAMAAYRACEAVQDNRTGEKFDFSRKTGLLYSEVITPEDAPDWARDRAELWNRSEEANRKGNAIVAREIQLSLPHELDAVQRRELTTNFARDIAERYGVAVDTCIHAPNKEGDQRNYHAHLMLCTRRFDATQGTGLSKNTVREFDPIACQKSKTENQVPLWRETWQRMLNHALERAEVRTEDGALVQVDHRSYKERELDIEPSIKEGPAATALRRRGKDTDRAAMNEAIKERNEERQRMAAEIDTPELNRRLAEQITAPQVRELLQPANDNAPPFPRRAEILTAPEAKRELTAANDNAPPAARSAEGMTAEQERQELQPAHSNATPLPRRAEVLTTSQITHELQPANDNAPLVARRAESLTAEQAQQELQPTEADRKKYEAYYKPLPGESAEEARERGDRGVERAKQREEKERQRAQQGHKREWDFER